MDDDDDDDDDEDDDDDDDDDDDIPLKKHLHPTPVLISPHYLRLRCNFEVMNQEINKLASFEASQVQNFAEWPRKS